MEPKREPWELTNAEICKASQFPIATPADRDVATAAGKRARREDAKELQHFIEGAIYMSAGEIIAGLRELRAEWLKGQL